MAADTKASDTGLSHDTFTAMVGQMVVQCKALLRQQLEHKATKQPLLYDQERIGRIMAEFEAGSADIQDAIIVDVEATPTRISKEVDATETMVARTEGCFDLKPDRLAGDVAYGTGEMLGWLVDREIEPHIPVWERSKVGPEGKFTRADFIYDDERDVYVCPNGKELRTSGTAHDGTTLNPDSPDELAI